MGGVYDAVIGPTTPADTGVVGVSTIRLKESFYGKEKSEYSSIARGETGITVIPVETGIDSTSLRLLPT